MIAHETATLLESCAIDLAAAADMLRERRPLEASGFADRSLVARCHAERLRREAAAPPSMSLPLYLRDAISEACECDGEKQCGLCAAVERMDGAEKRRQVSARFTKGPWLSANQSGSPFLYVLDDDGCNRVWAQIYTQRKRASDEEMDANRRLFQAAPSLYEACKAALDYVKPCPGPVTAGCNKCALVATLRTALAEADGTDTRGGTK